MNQNLKRSFYKRPALGVAHDLLGKYLVHQEKSGKIIETEAYIGPDDLACHASRGRTKRTETMFLPGGHAYIYLIYGMYYCLNIVTGKKDFPEAVLIRALECENCDGPGKLCRELGINLSQNGIDLTGNELYIEDRGEKFAKSLIVQTPRIGVDYAGSYAQNPWRFVIKNAKYLSKKVK